MINFLRALPFMLAAIFGLSSEAIAQLCNPAPGSGPQGCQNAPLFCSEAEFDGYECFTDNTPAGPCPPPFCGSCENYQWFSFIAGSTTIELQITPSNCVGQPNGSGLQAHMYATDDCTTFTAVSNCESPSSNTPIVVTGTNLEIGEVYYLMIDGWAGDECDYIIDVLQGIGNVPPPIIPGGITGELNPCSVSDPLSYAVPEGVGISDYEWEIIPAIGSIVSGQGTNVVEIVWNTGAPAPGLPAQICVTPSNACETGFPICIPVLVESIPPTLNFVEVCSGDTWECEGNTYTNYSTQTITYQTALGCDSVIQCIPIPIVVPPSPPFFEVICAPDCFTFNNQTYCTGGAYQTTFESYQGCDSIVPFFIFILEADAVIANPPVLGCGNTLITLDGSNSTSTPASTMAVLSYLWDGPGIVGPDDGLTVDVNQPGTYTLTVTHEQDGVVCTDQATVVVTEDTAVPDPPNLNGPIDVCLGDVDTYTASPAATGPTPDGYTWTVTGGTFTDNGNTIDVTWDVIGLGQVCVTADNDCGPSNQVCIDVNVGDGPADPVIDGLTDVCEGDQLFYTLNPIDPDATYSWTVTGGASFTDLGDSIQVNYSGAGDGQICVTATNSCGPSNEVCINITVTDVPAEPMIGGDNVLCDGQTGTYAVPNDPDATNYIWTTPNGEPISGQGTNAIMVDWTGSTGGDVCVQAENACGLSPQNCFPVTINVAPIATISGTGEFCAGSGDQVDLTITLTGTGPWDLTYTIDGANPTNITGIAASPYTLTVGTAGVYELTALSDQTACPGIVNGTATVTENPLPTAAISGTGAICQGSGDCVDLTVDLTGTPNWSITIAIDGAPQAPITGITATPYTYQACQGGDFTIVSVTDGNGCTDAGTGTATVTINDAPIVTNITRPCDPTNTTYEVIFEISGGDPASYTVNGSNAGITGGPPYIFTSNPINSGDAYSFLVTDINGCDTVLVEGTRVCDCTTEVGEMDVTPQAACGTDCITAVYDNTNEVFDGDDVIEYILHEGSGLSIVNEIARNNIPEFCYDGPAGMVYGTTYYISAVVGNDDGAGSVDLTDPCLAVAQGTPVVFNEEPIGDLSADGTICIGESIDLFVNFTGPAPWSIEYDDGSGTPVVLNGINTNPYTLTVSPTTTTTYTLTGISNANCPGIPSGSATVTVNEPPVVSNVTDLCNPTSTAYTISFEISGGDPGSYQVLPAGSGTITPGTPAVFTSNNIPSGDMYAFQITDANGCDTIDISGMIICNCLTEVGDMDLTPIDECGDGPITATYDATNESLDGDDVVEFILHEGAGTTILNEIARNTAPTFSFDPGTMTYGTTYYISAVAGNDDGAGSVDLADPCVDIAAGTPVTFYEVPTGTLSGDTEICLGESTTLPVVLTGDSPWTIIVSDGTANDTITGINSTTYNYSVSPTVQTTYTLVEIFDENCPGTAAGAAVVDVNEAPVASAPTITFNSTNSGYTVCFTISGGEAPYYVFNGVDSVFTDSLFCSQELPCGSGYSFSVDDGNGCGPIIVEEAQVNCTCSTQVGEMDLTPIEICGPGVPAQPTYDPTIEVLDGNDIVDYILHNGNNVPILTNNVPSFAFQNPLMYETTYFISARAGDDDGTGTVSGSDPCLSISDGTPVVFHQIPTASITGGGDYCAGECLDFEVTASGGVGPWSVEITNTAGDDTTFVVTTSPATLTVCPPGTSVYTIASVSTADCTGSGIGVAQVTQQGVPFGSNISVTVDPTNTFVTVCFDIVGGDTSTYVVNGWPGTISNSVFCSDPIPCSEGSYQLLVQDGFQCVTDTVQGPIVCSCTSDAGVMTGQTLRICEFEDVSATAASAFNLDGNDTIMYVLHTSNSDMLGTIIDINSTPDFSYNQATMDCDVTYFISSVVGDDDGTGQVDLTDDCLSVAVGRPVVWECLPEASFVGTNTICAGETSDITFSLNGEGPFDVTLNINGTDTTLTEITDGFVWQVAPGVTTTYSLLDIFDQTTLCANTAAGSVTITVNNPVTAGTPADPLEFCQDDATFVDLAAQLTGADPNGTWAETSASPSGGGAFNAVAGTFNPVGQDAGVYTFEYAIDAAAPCPDASATVTIIINEQPVADAGETQELNCNDLEVTIGGNSSTGANIEYEWTLQGSTNVLSTESTYTSADPGTFVLTVTNAVTGCSATDQVVVTESIETPVPIISVSEVSCFGENDGFILIDSIAGGVPPYLVSFDGGALSQQLQFSGLTAGSYTIVVEDSKGCETTVVVDVTQPDELIVELVGNFMTEDESINLGESVTLTIQPSVPFGSLDSVIWEPAELIECDSCQSNVVSPSYLTTFSVTIEDDGCIASDDLRVLVRKDRPIYIPNVFSPNDDGRNDVFFIQAGDIVEEIRTLQVFDRWGESVYVADNFLPNDPTFGWDGTLRGKDMNPGVYVYYLEVVYIDGYSEVIKGDVTLVR
jgi:gliding motility-associated-like protein